MSRIFHTICVNVDPSNPGQFFACCGLLELAGRLSHGTEGWFENTQFCLTSEVSLANLIKEIACAELHQIDSNDDMGSPIEIQQPFNAFRLDWWQDDRSGGRELKVWAGSMSSFRIARAMQHAIREQQFSSKEIFDIGTVVYDPLEKEKKVEPFYFDARRGLNAHSIDVGFAPNDLNMTTVAFPAVEFLCLVGLQRCLPLKSNEQKIFRYFTWEKPIAADLINIAAIGLIPYITKYAYEFENWFRTGQKKHKAFRYAVRKNRGE